MKVFESVNGLVAWDEQLQNVRIEWNGFSHGEGLQAVLMQGAELLRQKQSGKVLMDIRQGSVIKEEDKAWMADFYVEHVYKSGLRYLAMIEPSSIVAKLSVNRAVSVQGQLPYQQRSFSGLDEAVRWLSEVKPAAELAAG
ncbi:hypothetical protein [Paenibacillus typhae]|uniref:SpoIIAA-like n=1 Tax=Paenibacillus typhae TaxID=1174501 RepID=A0A1G9EGS2_9BACL|nr:hypothetical protein [Paenibacillus typhae]SDK75304.1 hypothetical protein SAMN05216192_15313 [Paenibacillus typhae]